MTKNFSIDKKNQSKSRTPQRAYGLRNAYEVIILWVKVSVVVSRFQSGVALS